MHACGWCRNEKITVKNFPWRDCIRKYSYQEIFVLFLFRENLGHYPTCYWLTSRTSLFCCRLLFDLYDLDKVTVIQTKLLNITTFSRSLLWLESESVIATRTYRHSLYICASASRTYICVSASMSQVKYIQTMSVGSSRHCVMFESQSVSTRTIATHVSTNGRRLKQEHWRHTITIR